MSSIYPKSRILKVAFEVVLPTDATAENIDEWLAIETGGGGISLDNPLINFSLETSDDIDWEDTGYHQHIEVSNIQKTANGSTFNVYRPRRREPYVGKTVNEILRDDPAGPS